MPGFVGIARAGRLDPGDEQMLDRIVEPLIHYDWFSRDALHLPTAVVAHVSNGILADNTLSEKSRICVGLHGELYNDDSAHVPPTDHIRSLYLKKGRDLPGT